jgi:hypothetical protein
MKVKAARSDKGWLDRKLASLKLRKGFEEESQKLAVGEHRDYASWFPQNGTRCTAERQRGHAV